MPDVGLEWNPTLLSGDAVLSQGDLAELDDLKTSAIISLFSWRRANADDRLPDGSDNPQGFWGDLFADQVNGRTGSRLWLLSREKLTQETLNRAKEYVIEALQWMIQDGVATGIDVQVERHGLHQLSIGIVITRQTGQMITLRFENVWEAIRNG